ncbi:hypothetical protein [Algoriphagus sp. AK58]|uniref:hypothetical protein n=1 Tax=Algoriphagus sp. AK58 TaxID=1406877 RepID=UPI00164FCD04|nr:hypothetical protein [Algoriphagus sp. AK58]MBC6368843.1 hypothetical protein [Algoriphagus sp. AK58]
MNLIELNENELFLANKGSKDQLVKLRRLVYELRKRELPDSIVSSINEKLEKVNSFNPKEKSAEKMLSQKLSEILKLVEKELHLVPRHHYRSQWMVLGMSAFGLPFGVVFGSMLDNMAFLGLGLPFGMAIGIAVGAAMDEKAQKEGRQLNLNVEE